MVNGSTINERITSTTKNTEISELEVSTTLATGPPLLFNFRALSISQTTTVIVSARVNQKPISISNRNLH